MGKTMKIIKESLSIFIALLVLTSIIVGQYKIIAQPLPYVIFGYVYMPDGTTPAEGATVTATCEEATDSATTDSDGYYQITITITKEQTITVKAKKGDYEASKSFKAKPGELGKMVNLTLKKPEAPPPSPPPSPPPPSPPSKEKSEITIDIIPVLPEVESRVNITGKIEPPHKAEVIIVIVKPDGTSFRTSVMSNENGEFLYTFIPNTTGFWKIIANWPGDEDTEGATVKKSLRVLPARKASVITLITTPSEVYVGETILIEGDIDPDIENANVTIVCRSPEGAVITYTVLTNSTGGFHTHFTPDVYGSWRVKATWTGNEEYRGAESERAVYVAGRKSTITISVEPPLPKKGTTLTIRGTIVPLHSNVSVTVTMRREGVAKEIGRVLTDEKGVYTVSLLLNFTGVIEIWSSWKGDRDNLGATSTIVTLVIKEEVERTEQELPDDGVAEVLAVSNSTSLSIRAIVEERRISANITGYAGTKGVMNVYIPEGLLRAYNSSLDKVLFMLDGKRLDYTAVNTTDGYIFILYYNHSVHGVDIYQSLDIYYAAYSISIRVLDYGKRPIGSAEVRVYGPVDSLMYTNKNGTVEFRSMLPGNYTIEVYYGSKVWEGEVRVVGDTNLTIITNVGKWKILYDEVVKEMEKLKKENEDLKSQLEATKEELEDLRRSYEILQEEVSKYRSLMLIPALIIIVLIILVVSLAIYIAKEV